MVHGEVGCRWSEDPAGGAPRRKVHLRGLGMALTRRLASAGVWGGLPSLRPGNRERAGVEAEVALGVLPPVVGVVAAVALAVVGADADGAQIVFQCRGARGPLVLDAQVDPDLRG